MKIERAIRVLEVEREFARLATGFHQQPINAEVVEACDIAIEALKEKMTNTIPVGNGQNYILQVKEGVENG